MLISVIIPVFNAEKYIEETILSILNQSHKELQIICVDNNSTDNSVNIIKTLKEKFSIIELYFEKQIGANYARNLGIEKAKGVYVQFLDSDDVITKNKLKDQSEFLDKSNLDIVVSDRAVFDSNLKNKLNELEFSSIIDSPLEIAISQIIITGNPLYRLEFVKKIGGYLANLKSAQDWEFHIRLFLNNPKFGYLKGVYLHSRFLKNSLSNSNYITVSDNACYSIGIHKEELLRHKVFLDKYAYKKILFTYFISFLHSTKFDIYKDEFLFWYKLNNGKQVFSFVNKILITLLGINNYLKIKKKIV
jgi:glycosyltransferase involved in cell wall biosynthesis